MVKLDVPLFCIDHAKIGGTESATYNHISALHQNDIDVSCYTSDVNTLSAEFEGMCREKEIPLINRKFFLKGKNFRFVNEAIFESNRGDIAALYPNYFSPSSIFKYRRKQPRTAAIVHDVQYKSHPEYHSLLRRKWLDFYLPKLFKSETIPIVISESERRFIGVHFGDSAYHRCRVVPNSINWDRYNTARHPSSHGRPYILSVFHPFPHKNIITLIRAFQEFCNHDEDYDLCIVGNMAEKTYNYSSGMPGNVRTRIKFKGFVSDLELGELYRNAAVFALPSIYEGFGMPAVEALGFGVPTIVSNSTAMPEVTLGMAVYVEDFLSSGAWAEAIRQTISTSSRHSPEAVTAVRMRYSPRNTGEILVSAIWG